ncbi:MAG: DnaD domain protein [Clostridia bacterium]|nr:DnaD domain protein [Clostridia bacterium]
MQMKEVTILPRALSLLLKETNGDAIRLYLHYLAKGDAEAEGAMHSLNLTREAYAAAYAELMSLELLPKEKRVLDEAPATYTREEIARITREDPEFLELVQFAERRLGHVSSVSEVQTLLNIYHWQGLPCSVIMLLVGYCADQSAKQGRRLTMGAIRNTANKWINQGIDTPDKADQYLRTLEGQSRYLNQVTRMLHITALTPSVEAFIREWADKKMDLDLVERAADISAMRFSGNLNFRYMNGILRGWFEKGYFTLEAVEANEGKRDPSPAFGQKRKPETAAAQSQSELDSIRKAREFYEKHQREKKE